MCIEERTEFGLDYLISDLDGIAPLVAKHELAMTLSLNIKTYHDISVMPSHDYLYL